MDFSFLSHLVIKDLMIAVLTGFAALLLLIMWLMHRNKDNSFDITDLVSTDGKLNERKFCRFGAWAVSTWGFVFLACDGKLTEWYFSGYMAAWVASAILGKMVNDKGAAAKTPAEPTGEKS